MSHDLLESNRRRMVAILSELTTGEGMRLTPIDGVRLGRADRATRGRQDTRAHCQSSQAWVGCHPAEPQYDHTYSHIIFDMATAERVTVTLRADLLEQIDRVERNRSRFIAQAVEHELDRRRREALLDSVAAPHPESVELADAPLGDWVSDLPADEELVDRTGGTAVRWVEGKGWLTEP